MLRSSTRADYGRRIARVTEHIAGHLDGSLDVETLAAVAHFSPWHFHRIYRGVTGETVADTVRRLRLHRAAVELVRGETPLGQVARRAGYSTLAAFSRAFAAHHGLPPGAYRRRRRPPAPATRHPAAPVPVYEVSIAPFAGIRLAAVAHRGDYQDIGRAFERLLAWAAAHGVRTPDTRSIAVYEDDPRSVPVAALRSEAGLGVDARIRPAGEIHIREIPPLLCASVVHRGPYAELERPYDFLYRDWLPASGREPADHPCFEEYLNNPRELPPSEWRTRIHLPVEP